MSDLNTTSNTEPRQAPAEPPYQAREIVFRGKGTKGGPITRLVSPSDVGNLIKPFVFFDAVNAQPGAGPNFGFHPHSGIATVTLLISGSIWYEETNGRRGELAAGDVEWVRAGGGVWHAGGLAGTAPMKAFQMWLALPPELESTPAESRYVRAAEVSYEWPVRVILGRYGNARSPIDSPARLNYLDVSLKAGERWIYVTPPRHDVGWVVVYEGSVRVPDLIESGELVVFSESEGMISFEAAEDTRFLLGSAAKHPYPLVLGRYSVHTSEAALSTGEAEIRRIGVELHGLSRRAV
ncbi:pirin family protein [Massilia sp. CMS3.1]|uniref:pirin family protein n=1 Tax=Massilia sp. CMS3.1 TaxID=3373083 RepID=UPI003EE818DC